MSVAVSVHQPNFMPWLKLLDKILASDVYVAYDTVQYTRSEFHARQKIKYENGATWLSAPVVTSGAKPWIRDVQIDNKQPFRGRQLSRIRNSYQHSPHFDEIYPILEEIYRGNQELLVELNLQLIESFCRYLGSDVRIVRATDFPHPGDRTERIVQLVRAVGGDVHLTSTVGSERNYIEWELFEKSGIDVEVQQFEHPVYAQPFGEFLPDLAAVDMLFSCGRDTAEILAERRSVAELTTFLEAG